MILTRIHSHQCWLCALSRRYCASTVIWPPASCACTLYVPRITRVLAIDWKVQRQLTVLYHSPKNDQRKRISAIRCWHSDLADRLVSSKHMNHMFGKVYVCVSDRLEGAAIAHCAIPISVSDIWIDAVSAWTRSLRTSLSLCLSISLSMKTATPNMRNRDQRDMY